MSYTTLVVILILMAIAIAWCIVHIISLNIRIKAVGDIMGKISKEINDVLGQVK